MNPYSSRGAAGTNVTGKPAGEIVPRGFDKARLKNFTPEQMQLYQQLFGHVGPESQLSRLAMGDEGAFQDMEAPAWRLFQEAQGQLGSRFSGMGMGATRGSGFKNAAGQLGSDFAMQLQANRQNLMRQALNDLMGYSNTLLNQRPYEQSLVERQQKQQNPSFWSQLGSGALSLAGGYFGGGGGAAAGKFIGDNIFGGANDMASGSISNF